MNFLNIDGEEQRRRFHFQDLLEWSSQGVLSEQLPESAHTEWVHICQVLQMHALPKQKHKGVYRLVIEPIIFG